MSISLLISGENIPEEKWKNIPIATENTFREFWLPLIEDSELIPFFEVGLDINIDNLDEVIKELRILEIQMTKLAEQNSDYEKPLERVRELLKILPEVISSFSQVFIG